MFCHCILQSNHKHLFLQSEDKLYVNLGSDKNQEDEASNILIANKQWRVIPIRYAYLGSNWPIRVSPQDNMVTPNKKH